MGQLHTRRIAEGIRQVEMESLALLQVDLAVGKLADPQLWSLQIKHDAGRTAHFRFQLADRAEPIFVILVRAVAEIEPEYIDSRLHEGGDTLQCRGRGSEGGDDLGTAVAFHKMENRPTAMTRQ